ncbi:bacillithiol biosynthesis cysteine-adding enzyme BshC [Salinicoccus albus]|uniref:bacillithiol biosynthesis cysteine-adding enzyme BshC n=1 Tax=Salinicoccus albus TaxID=418756 RepID=UPI00037931E6|nr:bacillithiol biosynthesis cysteine-adding enzyme BshC [Salinicoccus albus]
MEIECINFQKDKFLERFSKKDETLLGFYQNMTYDKESIDSVLDRPVHDHTEKLADIIEEEMAVFGLSEPQRLNIDKLRSGHRVVIGGQQAGLFMSPAYIMHKIITLLVLTDEIRENFDYEAVPVFWVAGEDHDFEEVNHTHIYDRDHRRRQKISYKPNLTVPMSLGFYKYDKAEMKNVLDRIIEACGDSSFLKEKKRLVAEMIETNDYWTELFHALVHDAFKEDGLIIFNAHSRSIRELEIPMFEQMVQNHSDIDRAFRHGQKVFNRSAELRPVIETDSNAHLFTGSDYKRTLLEFKAGEFHSDDGPVDKSALLQRLYDSPETFSNNVVTRPLMQEMLFNTLIFAGGGAEVKYWGELHEVFDAMDLKMPIVLKRMEIIHADQRTVKLMTGYNLRLSPDMMHQAEVQKESLVRENTDESFKDEVDEIAGKLQKDYKIMLSAEGRDQYEDLIKANMHIHERQLDYLKKRYQLEVKRSLRHQLNDLDEAVEKLMPDGALQERVYHPWVFQVPSTMPPLRYTTDLTIIKTF